MMISKKINMVFKKREQYKQQVMRKTILSDNGKIYNLFKKNHEEAFADLQKERSKIMMSKKKRYKIERRLKQNTLQNLLLICAIIKEVWIHFEKKFYESDYYRQKKLQDIKNGQVSSIDQEEKNEIDFDKIKQQNLADVTLKAMEQIKIKAQAKEMLKMKILNNRQESMTKLINNRKEEERKDKLRQIKLEKIKKKQDKMKLTDESKRKHYVTQLKEFLDSPFENDRRFCLLHLAQESRDDLESSEDFIKLLFFDRVFNMIIDDPFMQEPDEFNFNDNKKEVNHLKAIEILTNMVEQSHSFRHKLCSEKNGYLKDIFDLIQEKKLKDQGSLMYDQYLKLQKLQKQHYNRVLVKLTWLITLMSMNEKELYDQIISLNIIGICINLMSPRFSSNVRCNVITAIDQMAYNEKIFEQLMNKDIITKLLMNCKESNTDIDVKVDSIQALVHLALNEKSIKQLIQKGVMELLPIQQFCSDADSYSKMNDELKMKYQLIQLNTAWIFLALCRNGVTGETMLKQGITLNMFLISCNSGEFENEDIRHLVISGFAELGKQEYFEEEQIEQNDEIKQRANYHLHEEFQIQENSDKIIEVLLYLTASNEIEYQVCAYKCLKDYIYQSHQKLARKYKLLTQIQNAFIYGCYSTNVKIILQCAKAICFLITQHLLYKEENLSNCPLGQLNLDILQEETMKGQSTQILDAIMYLSGSQYENIRGIAFSTLSSLSTYSSQHQSVLWQIKRDSQFPDGFDIKKVNEYYNFIKDRLKNCCNEFENQFMQNDIQKQFSGLYSMLSLAQNPNEKMLAQSIDNFLDFIKLLQTEQSEKDSLLSKKEQNFLDRNELYFIKVFCSIFKCNQTYLIEKMLKVICYYIDNKSSKYVNDMLTPEMIIWLLNIQKDQTISQHMRTKTAMVMLQIVMKHDIVIQFQEVEIITLFRKILVQVKLLEGTQSEQNEVKNVEQCMLEDQSSSRKQLFALLNGHDKLSGLSDQNSVSSMIDTEESKDTEIDKIQIENLETFENLQNNEYQSESVKSFKLSQKGGLNVRKLSKANITFQKMRQNQRRKTSTTLVKLMENYSFELDTRSILQKLEDFSMEMPLIQVETMFMDNIVKSFMLIFTNEHCHHLLLNEDLIEIAISCLENIDNISYEVQNSVSKLLSKVLKYPKIQSQIIDEGINCFRGISYMLQLMNDHKIKRLGELDFIQNQKIQIIKQIIEGCLYISMNNEFVNNSNSSLQILKPVMNILGSKKIMSLMNKIDLLRITKIIRYTIKGTSQAKKCFQEANGINLFTQIILDNHSEINNHDQDEGLKNVRKELLIFCLEGISEHISSKEIVQKIIENNTEYCKLIDVMKKTFLECEQWPIQINQYDPFNEKNNQLKLNVFGQQYRKLTRENPIFTSSKRIQNFFKQLENNEQIVQNANSKTAEKYQVSSQSQDEVLMIDKLEEALLTHQSKFEEHYRLSQIRVSSYFLFYGLIKYKIESNIDDSMIENIIKRLTDDLEFLCCAMDSNIDNSSDQNINYSNYFYNEMQKQFQIIFNCIIKVLGALQKNQKTLSIFLSIESDNQHIRKMFFKSMSQIKNQNNKLSLMFILCSFIIEYKGQNDETFVEQAEKSQSNFRVSTLISNLFDIQSSDKTMEIALWTIIQILEQKKVSKSIKTQQVMIQSMELLENKDVLQSIIQNILKSQVSEIVKMSLQIILSLLQEMLQFDSMPQQIYSIYCQIVEMSYNLDDIWLSSFDFEKQKIFQVSLCEVLHTIQTIDMQQISTNTNHHDLQMIQNILETNYSLSNTEEDTDSEIDELVNQTLEQSQSPKQQKVTKNTMQTPQFVENGNLDYPEKLQSEVSNSQNNHKFVNKSIEALQKIVQKVTVEQLDINQLDQLIQNGLISVCRKFIFLFNQQKSHPSDLLDLMQFSMAQIKLIQNIGLILLNISQIANNAAHDFDKQSQTIQILHKLCVKGEFDIISLARIMLDFKFYDLQINLFQTIFNFLTPFDSPKITRPIQILKFEIQTKAITLDLLLIMIENCGKPIYGWLKIGEICKEFIQKMNCSEQYLFKLNRDYLDTIK